MKILHLCSRYLWEHKMSRVRFHSINAIGRHPEVELIKSGPGWEDFENCKQVQDKYNPDIIVWYKPMEMLGFEQVTTLTCLRYNEMWDIKFTSDEILMTKTKIVICHHKNDIKNYNHIKSAKFVHNPHCAEKNIFKDYCMPKDIDIQLIGVISPEFYPLRSKLHNIIITKMISNGIKYRILPHPGYRIDNVDDQVINYARQLNRAKINLTCSSKYKYALAKYSEVPLCKSLLIADMPNENKDWYNKWLITVSMSDSDSKIIEILNNYLINNSMRKEKIDIGFNENIRFRSQENYAEKFIKIVKDYLK